MTELSAEKLAALREIAGFPGYRISRDGRVFSTASNWRGYGVREITPIPGKGGYLKVRLTVEGKRLNRAVHRLVAEEFLPPRPAGAQIRHLDGDRVNNAASNLAWGSAKDNADDRKRHGRTAEGSRNGSAEIDEATVRLVRELRSSGLLYREITDKTGVTRQHARLIVTREIWSHVI